MPTRAAIFSQAGAALCGSTWKNHLSRVLGPLHPDGARDQVDPRLIRRWASGDRPIPDWVLAALLEQFRARQTEGAAIINEISRVLTNVEEDILTSDLLTTDEAAAALGLSIKTVQSLIKRGRLPAKKIGRDWMIKRKDVAGHERGQGGRPRRVPGPPYTAPAK